MTAEAGPYDNVTPLPGREVRGQIRFDPNEEFEEHLSGLFLPEKRELGRRGLFLASQYVLVSRLAGSQSLAGKDEQKAARLRRALQHGKDSQHRLNRYMQFAERTLGDHEFIALQFAIQLHPRTIHDIEHDDILRVEPLLRDGETAIKAVLVYEGSSIYGEKEREALIRKIGDYVMDDGITGRLESATQRRSPNSQAYVTNPRFTFS